MRRAAVILPFCLFAAALGAGEPSLHVPELSAAAGRAAPEILGEALHPPRGAERWRRFVALLAEAGAERAAIRIDRIPGLEAPNVVYRLPGSDPAAGAIVLGAHTDCESRGEGAIDDWSGCVMLAALLVHARSAPRRHPFLFVGFGEEERGLDGSAAFAGQLERSAGGPVRAMLNLECLGVGEPRVWANRSADALERILFRAGEEAQVPLRRQILFGLRADAFSFDRAGVPAAVVHSLSATDLAKINGPGDRREVLRPRAMRDAFRLLAAALDRLDRLDGALARHDGERPLRPAAAGLSGAIVAGEGMRLSDLPRRSVERAAGVRPGDVLLGVDGELVRDRAELDALLLTLWEGQTVSLSLRRPDGQVEIPVGY